MSEGGIEGALDWQLYGRVTLKPSKLIAFSEGTDLEQKCASLIDTLSKTRAKQLFVSVFVPDDVFHLATPALGRLPLEKAVYCE